MDYLVVVDLQNDFVSGSLGSPQAIQIVPKVVDKIKNFNGTVCATRDTHHQDYLDTQEGHLLPVKHCIASTWGWGTVEEVEKAIRTKNNHAVFYKDKFGSLELVQWLKDREESENIDSITLVGLCTDICVITNALLLKTFFPEAPIKVDASCCAGVTPASHNAALQTMMQCQIILEE